MDVTGLLRFVFKGLDSELYICCDGFSFFFNSYFSFRYLLSLIQTCVYNYSWILYWCGGNCLHWLKVGLCNKIGYTQPGSTTQTSLLLLMSLIWGKSLLPEI